jgi:hypothetical protein
MVKRAYTVRSQARKTKEAALSRRLQKIKGRC